MTHLKGRLQAAWTGTTTHFGTHLLLPEASRYPTARPLLSAQNEHWFHSTSAHAHTRQFHCIHSLPGEKWIPGAQRGFRFSTLGSDNLVHTCCCMHGAQRISSALSCPEMSGSVEIDHCVLLATTWTPSTYHPSWKREFVNQAAGSPSGLWEGDSHGENEKQRNRSIPCPRRPYVTVSGFEWDKCYYHYHLTHTTLSLFSIVSFL